MGMYSFLIDSGMPESRDPLSSIDQGWSEREDVPTRTLQAVRILQMAPSSASDLGRHSALRSKPFKQ